MAFLLDTNVFAAIAQPKPQRAVERAFVRHAQEIVTSTVVLHEMWFGIEHVTHFEPFEGLRIENWAR